MASKSVSRRRNSASSPLVSPLLASRVLESSRASLATSPDAPAWALGAERRRTNPTPRVGDASAAFSAVLCAPAPLWPR
eukprot:scaffold578_cov243-Pinguiococcus_pyrenoidosus.AAC.6